jgi:hypothetical protein
MNAEEGNRVAESIAKYAAELETNANALQWMEAKAHMTDGEKTGGRKLLLAAKAKGVINANEAVLALKILDGYNEAKASPVENACLTVLLWELTCSMSNSSLPKGSRTSAGGRHARKA